MIQALIGLGNPGPKYDKTRHNAGFWLVDELARRHGGQWRDERKFHGQLCQIHMGAHSLWLLKPDTFMNRSGRAAQALASYYKIDTSALLVVHDELDLPPGVAKLKRGGGHGGHNGLRDCHAQLGKDYLRLRLGIGHPGHRDKVTDYVLHAAGKAEQQDIDIAVNEAADIIPTLVSDGLEKAMLQLHTKP